MIRCSALPWFVAAERSLLPDDVLGDSGVAHGEAAEMGDLSQPPSCPSKSGRGSIAPARRVVRRASGLRSRSNGAASRPALACKCRGAEACDALPSFRNSHAGLAFLCITQRCADKC